MIDSLKKNHVTIRGKENADQTILFAHGFGTDQSAWSDVAAAFSDDYRIILYDNAGAGQADPGAFSPNKYDTLDSYAQDLTDICERLGIRDAIMVGHSVSGMASILASINVPHHFSKLVLIGASPRYLNDVGYVGGFEQEDLNGLYQTMTNHYFAWVSGFSTAAMANPDRPELAASFAKTLETIRPDIAQAVIKVIFESDYRSILSEVNKPTLIIQANEDIAVPLQVAEFLHQNIKGSQLEIVKATGHFPHISAPEEIIGAIKKFI